MNRYQAQVKVSGFSLKTIVYADSSTHARLLLQQQFLLEELDMPMVIHLKSTILKQMDSEII